MAIMDVDQHMYMAIEAVETKFLVVGVLHYSIAGERALFKVCYLFSFGTFGGYLYLSAKDEKLMCAPRKLKTSYIPP